MVHRISKCLLLTVLFLCVYTFTVWAEKNDQEKQFTDGTGTEDDPYVLSTAEDLYHLSMNVYNGNEYYQTFFIMTEDIDLSQYKSGEGWLPIGGRGQFGNSYFRGNVNGMKHTVRNLVVNRPEEDYCGLFGI